MMSYLWILLIGSLLASHARAQEEGDLAPTTSDPVTEEVPVAEGELEADTEAENTATEEPEVDGETVPDADPGSEVEEAVIPTASDPEAVTPAEDAEPAAPEEDDEEEEDEEEEEEEDATVADEATEVPVVGDVEIVTEAPTDESDQILATEEPTDESDQILATEEPTDESDPIVATEVPETEEDVETTTPIEEAEVPTEEGAETTSTPVNELIVTTTVIPVAETSTTTQAANPVVIDEEAKQTTAAATTITTTITTTTTGVKEVPVTTKAPAKHKEITTASDVSGEDEATTPDSIIPEVVEKIQSDVIKAVHQADMNGTGSRMIYGQETASEGAAADATRDDQASSEEGGSKPLAAVLSGIIVSAVGAVAGYFTYQKKKLCFKKKQEADPEAGNKVEKVDPADAQSNPETLAPLVEKH